MRNLSRSSPPSSFANKVAASNAQEVNIFEVPSSILPAKEVETIANSNSKLSVFFRYSF
uniref:Uncharacterized protein n=1 Tax=uncultured Poseidoniia archaeon TaxID=1697135 RepID=A0A1B1TA81_9ARCH|nr:hypothetical protein [uncultured Candidatus Thalassoarchaea sp.]